MVKTAVADPTEVAVEMVAEELELEGEIGLVKPEPEPQPPQYGLPTLRWSDFKYKFNSTKAREFIQENGEHLLTADGQDVWVVMTLEQYYSLKPVAPKDRPMMTRSQGKLFREV